MRARAVRERKRRGPAVSGSRERRGEGAADWAGRALAWAELGSWASCRAGTKGTAGGGEKKSWVEVGRNQVGEVLICLFFFLLLFPNLFKTHLKILLNHFEFLSSKTLSTKIILQHECTTRLLIL